MRKLYKLMSIGSITIELDDHAAKELSRVKFRVIEDSDPRRTHTTSAYANINDNTISWGQPLQLRYTGQSRLDFETFCEHEYGYAQDELRVLYKGTYYLRNDMFFRPDSTHVYDLEGEKKGLLKWEIRVITKEEEEVRQPVVKEQPLVREDLVGLIKLYQASLEISNPIFNAKKHQNLSLRIKLAEQEQLFKVQSPLSWNLGNLKLQHITNGTETIEFQLLQQGRPILEGRTHCSDMQQRRRYIHYRVPLFSRNGIRIGSLLLDYRFIEKQELLDLIYSPNSKLSQTSPRSSREFSSSRALGKPKNKPNESSSVFQLSSSKAANSRYKIGYLMNHNSDIKIPKAARFSSSLAMNPNVSYLDPQKASDFAAKKQRGPYITKSSKFDFTRQFLGNPGVGSYKLPSIWSKY